MTEHLEKKTNGFGRKREQMFSMHKKISLAFVLIKNFWKYSAQDDLIWHLKWCHLEEKAWLICFMDGTKKTLHCTESQT